MRAVASLLVVGLVLTACGSDTPSLNRSDASAVFRSALDAFGRADLPALHGLLTPRARQTFMADLRAFRDGLALPEAARVGTNRLVEARFPGESEQRLQAAKEGGPAGALALLVALRPVEVPQQPRVARRPSGVQVFFYRDAQDVERAVHLIRDKSGWWVQRLEF